MKKLTISAFVIIIAGGFMFLSNPEGSKTICPDYPGCICSEPAKKILSYAPSTYDTPTEEETKAEVAKADEESAVK